MTNLTTNAESLPARAVRDEAVAVARAAAGAAGVEIRELTEVAELTAAGDLFESIWRSAPGARPLTTELLRAMSSAGNYVAGAFGQGELLGACFGFFGHPGKGGLHSHIAGVAASGAGRGIGQALKLHQRGWALAQDVSVISWTFDPLVRRNAYFNLGKLGALPLRYLPDFYGPMADRINGSGETDRLMVGWDLTSPAVRAASFGEPVPADARAWRERGASIALSAGPDGGPVTGSTSSPVVLAAVPSDIERLRHDDPGRAAAWRSALREVLGGLMADGARVTGFDRAGWYVITKEQS
ncbi:GNAT family N-acetyltransferase [Amycolatopsis saalfeldensis]|uniref:Predicted acetyltransferase, GNAT superfamily n=1 Tax=Amycolatopsis saalfeldensis TaxID=394193 RepID=A0A1H8XGX4_9PSEU|nr:GNAT family N-acetyltransferase [Amycolatopsis saalfeldensis]SEP38977.1 Predicted acetyltransferase, GNAT superfamily [Amycolatopsis saalfeldensis]